MFENKERAEKRHGDRDGKQERRKDLFEGSNRNIVRKPQAKRYANGGNDEKPLFHTTNLQNPLQKVKQMAQILTEFRWRCKYKYSLDSG